MKGGIVANTKDALGDTSGTTAIATFKINESTRRNIYYNYFN